eukprot:4121266-Alexandrium_andersonii.AAC.1
MSASLVGSEMCIRDRCVQEAARNSSTPPVGMLYHACFELLALAEGCDLCLLYTSDAADDM